LNFLQTSVKTPERPASTAAQADEPADAKARLDDIRKKMKNGETISKAEFALYIDADRAADNDVFEGSMQQLQSLFNLFAASQKK
jgi:hypothetical protein